MQKSRRIQFGKSSGPGALCTLIWLSFLSTADWSMTNSLNTTLVDDSVVGSDNGRRSAATCWKKLLIWSASLCTFMQFILTLLLNILLANYDQNIQLHVINTFQISIHKQLSYIQPNNIIVNTTSRDLQLVWIGIKK